MCVGMDTSKKNCDILVLICILHIPYVGQFSDACQSCVYLLSGLISALLALVVCKHPKSTALNSGEQERSQYQGTNSSGGKGLFLTAIFAVVSCAGRAPVMPSTGAETASMRTALTLIMPSRPKLRHLTGHQVPESEFWRHITFRLQQRASFTLA